MSDPTPAPTTPPPTPDQPPKQHGCLLAWLGLMILANLAGVIMLSATIRNATNLVATLLLAVLGFACVVNLLCVVMLLQWKKLGFYGIVVTSVVAFAVNLVMGVNLIHAVLGFVGPAILYGVLNIGGENKAWDRLK